MHQLLEALNSKKGLWIPDKNTSVDKTDLHLRVSEHCVTDYVKPQNKHDKYY